MIRFDLNTTSSSVDGSLDVAPPLNFSNVSSVSSYVRYLVDVTLSRDYDFKHNSSVVIVQVE